MHYLRSCLLGLFMLASSLVSGCCGPRCEFNRALDMPNFTGGGQDMIMSELPFEAGYGALCTQGDHGSTSHSSRSTMYDVDLDTPNDQDIPVFVPLGGRAYVHDQSPTTGFGIHVNIDLGDGTYIIIAHLSAVFVDNGSEVTAGQLLGYEGTTGNSFGDHVHFGRHAGDASQDGINGQSFEGLTIDMVRAGEHVQLSTVDMVCALPGGTTYTSRLPTPKWHPNGSLVKTPSDPTVYVVENGGLTPFNTESSFTTRRLSFNDVALISDSEADCYGRNPGLSTETEISAIYGAFPNQAVWLLVGQATDPERYRQLVPMEGWQAVLKSWGIQASTYDDLREEEEGEGLVQSYDYLGPATFRNGTLVSPVEDSAVYVMSDGVALPIETWETLLLAGWEDRQIIEVGQQDFDMVVPVQGSCVTNAFCLTSDDLLACGGPNFASQDTSSTITSTTASNPLELNDLELSWFTPDNEDVDFITLSGAVSHPGVPESGWQSVFNEVQNNHVVTVSVPGLTSGDSLRFSAESLNDGARSWSCLAPYPPGTLQGSVIADWGGHFLAVSTADDPESNGCGLRVTVP